MSPTDTPVTVPDQTMIPKAGHWVRLPGGLCGRKPVAGMIAVNPALSVSIFRQKAIGSKHVTSTGQNTRMIGQHHGIKGDS